MTIRPASPNSEGELPRLTLLSERRHIDGRLHRGLDRWDGDVFLFLLQPRRVMPDRCDGQLAEDVTGALVAGSETERSDGEEDDAHSLSLGIGRQIGPMRNDPSPTTSYRIFATSRPDGIAVIPVPAVTNQVPNVTIPDEILNVIVLGGGFDRFRNHVSDLPRVHARGEIERSRALSSRLHCSANGRMRNA